jgi:hypothetical protein
VTPAGTEPAPFPPPQSAEEPSSKKSRTLPPRKTVADGRAKSSDQAAWAMHVSEYIKNNTAEKK